MAAHVRILSYVRVSAISKMAACNRKWIGLYTTNFCFCTPADYVTKIWPLFEGYNWDAWRISDIGPNLMPYVFNTLRPNMVSNCARYIIIPFQ